MTRSDPLPVRPFFALALGWSFAFWAVPIVMGWPIWEAPATVFLYLGGAGVPLAGIAMIWRTGGAAGLRKLGMRLTDPRRIPPAFWALVLGWVPALHLAAAAIAAIFFAGEAEPLIWRGPQTVGDIWPALAFTGFILLLGPLPEEIGWRGYALGALLSRHGPLTASLLLFAGWGAWHVPLFLMPGYYDPFGGPPNLWIFFGELAANTVILTWIFLNTRCSVLAAVLYHVMVNYTGELLILNETAALIKTALLMLTGATVGGLLIRGARERADLE